MGEPTTTGALLERRTALLERRTALEPLSEHPE